MKTMKKFGKICISLAFILCCLIGITVNAQAATTVDSGICGVDLTWTLDSDGKLTISGTGAMTEYALGRIPWYNSRGSIKSVEISSGVTSISGYAFYECTQLESINLGKKVETIGKWAFQNCYKLSSITFPNSLTSIGESAFKYCNSLTSVNIPNSVVSVAYGAFQYCEKLEYISFGNGITSIGGSALYNCDSLTTVIMGNHIDFIGSYAFYSCDNLTNVYITDLSVWCGISFDGAYANPLHAAKNIYIDGEKTTYLQIPDGVSSISVNAFYNCDSIFGVYIPDSVTSIGSYAFYDCDALYILTTHDGVKSIGGSAFENCSDLTSVKLGENVTDIGYLSFAYCDNLTQIKFYGKAPNINYAAFKNVTSAVYYPNNDDTWTQDKLQHYSGGLTWIGYTPLKILAQPEHIGAIIGDTIKSTVKATGDGLTYSWGVKLDSSSEYVNSSNTSATYSLKVKDDTQNRWIYCRIKDKYGDEVWTNFVYLQRVNVAIKTQPASQNVKDGATAKFKTAANGTNVTYQWQYRTSSDGSWKNTSATGNKTKILSISATAAKHGYQYRCMVTDIAGNSVYTKVVTLNVLAIKTQPGNKIVKDGATAKFTVKATGTGLKYQWQYRTSSDGSWKNTSATGCKTKTLSISATAAKHGYQYRCRITDAAGNKLYTKTVTMKVLGIKVQPVSKSVAAGKTAKFTVSATGSGLKYQWQYRTSSSGSWKTTSATGNKTKTLSISATTAKHGYQYRCKITDSAGNVLYTKAVSMYVLGIKTQPINKSVKEGAVAKFTVKATGKGLTYQWQYRTSSKGSWKNVSAASGKKATYGLTAQDRHNGYQYRCRITDSAGNVVYSKTVKLTVK